jgi:UrcA family protein
MRNLIVAVAVSIVGLCAPALAETRISLWGYDFSDSRDVVAVHDRVAVAAKRACDQTGDRSLSARTYERNCRIAFVEEAIAKINQPTLTAFNGALQGNQRIARLGDRAPQDALIALAAAMPAATGAIRAAASE